ncbi:hypothetical protein Hdeb2414_s0260g00850831 [Helianthus debilis subsp. tardiflorus]
MMGKFRWFFFFLLPDYLSLLCNCPFSCGMISKFCKKKKKTKKKQKFRIFLSLFINSLMGI